jgi:hypothetical protein
VLIPGAVPRYVVALGIDREAARGIAQQFLAGSALPRILLEGGRIQELSLCYVPFYEFTGIRLGTFLLKEHVKPPAPQTEDGTEDPGFQRWLLEPSVERGYSGCSAEFVRIGPGCDLPELGMTGSNWEMRRGRRRCP